jgi:hypothetical protein
LSSARIWLIQFEQFSIFVLISCFSAKNVGQSRVEQLQFEQFTPTQLFLCVKWESLLCRPIGIDKQQIIAIEIKMRKKRNEKKRKVFLFGAFVDFVCIR